MLLLLLLVVVVLPFLGWLFLSLVDEQGDAFGCARGC
jgi:hypothetical protein